MRKIKDVLRHFVAKMAFKVSPVRWKEFKELSYWKNRKNIEGVLSNKHYEYFYTSHFGLDGAFYVNKTILDVGCGPRGSLEWASMALRRIGLDPLANDYLRLGADQHAMEYINASSERIPLKDDECDVVFSFNSLDHVEDVEQTLAEIKRVTRPGGLFLLLVEVNHPPTDCEPHLLRTLELLEILRPEFICEDIQVYKPTDDGIYKSIYANEKFPNYESVDEIGYLSARFVCMEGASDLPEGFGNDA